MTTKTAKVRWNGEPGDPDETRAHGVTFVKGEWTDVPHDKNNEAHAHRMRKLRGNPQFEVKGEDQDLVEAPEAPPAMAGPVRPPTTTYKVAGSKKEGFRVVDENGMTVGDDVPFKTAEDAQTAADMLNAPKPA